MSRYELRCLDISSGVQILVGLFGYLLSCLDFGPCVWILLCKAVWASVHLVSISLKMSRRNLLPFMYIVH